MDYNDCAARIAETGLVARGGFIVEDGDGVPPFGDRPARSLVLIGNAGSSIWPAFSRSPEYRDGRPDPLDRWSERVVGEIAGELSALAVFPFKGPPYHPFLRWARRAEAVAPSPLGMLIQPEYGLWHAYRGALVFDRPLEGLSDQPGEASPCLTCEDQPCLRGCPVAAFGPEGFEVHRCVSHLDGPNRCRDEGCLARNACPAGKPFKYVREQHRFHLAAFHRAQKRS